MPRNDNISIQRQRRARRKVTGNTPGIKDRNCIDQDIVENGTWPSGQPKQYVKYLHVTKGWRTRLLPPLHFRRLNLHVR